MKYYAGLILGILFSGLNYQDNSQTEKGIMVKQNEKEIRPDSDCVPVLNKNRNFAQRKPRFWYTFN